MVIQGRITISFLMGGNHTQRIKDITSYPKNNIEPSSTKRNLFKENYRKELNNEIECHIQSEHQQQEIQDFTKNY
ncbi:unnamed protein product [Paramecium octaurelia]|uniref:Uncharacterized protein n=1 Tax=Paramecium octaurelia TaxID=43137 RepID=A0A8S1VKG3_PAROT|nr:unnamed protein product [Paramecium octaurelia]